jgi:general stress protein 26
VAMFETAAELAALQQLLDASFGRASGQLVSIMTPERRLSASDLSKRLPSPAVLNLATVTAAGEPRISAVDGHFLHGRWYFTTTADSPKARHLVARPGVSVSFTPRDGFGAFWHGQAHVVEPGPDRDRVHRHLARTYGQDPEEWGLEIAYFVIDATWVTGFAMTPAEQAEIDAAPGPGERPDPWDDSWADEGGA